MGFVLSHLLQLMKQLKSEEEKKEVLKDIEKLKILAEEDANKLEQCEIALVNAANNPSLFPLLPNYLIDNKYRKLPTNYKSRVAIKKGILGIENTIVNGEIR